MRRALILSAVLAASAARAANVVYEHPALKVRLTVHTVEGSSAPDALSYEGPEGFYLITESELSSLERGDGYSDIRYDVRELTAAGFLSQDESYEDAKPCRYSDDACAAAIGKALGELIGRGKQEAPDEFAARVVVLRRRAEQTRASWRALQAEASSGSGTILDQGALDAATAPLAKALAAVEAARAARVAGEYRAAVAAPTAADPNPKADFYCAESRSLDAASAALSRADAVLASETVPNY